MEVDLRTCKKGDILISRHGWILEYVGVTDEDAYMDHIVKYLTDEKGNDIKYCGDGSRTHDGFVYRKKRRPNVDHDIVDIIYMNDCVV